MAVENSLLKGFNLSKIVSGVNDTLNFVNRAIPIYKQVTPVIKNVKSAFNTVGSIKKVSEEAKLKEAEALKRPVNVFKKTLKNNEERGKLNLDTLTFFQ